MAVGAIARDLPISRLAVEVTFVADGPNRTRLELEHRKLGRHGDGWESMREGVGSDDGWQKGLDALARVVAA
jgi:hypothetical protein